MPLLQNAQYIRWFLAHVDELLPLLELPEQLRQAITFTQKWEIIKRAGDIIVNVIESFPVANQEVAEAMQMLEAEAIAKEIPWDRLLELLPLLIRLITLLEKGADA